MKKIILGVGFLLMGLAAFSQQRISQLRSKEDKLNEEYCTGLFKTAEGTYFDFMDGSLASTAAGYRNVVDWLQGRVAGLQIYKTRDNISIPFIRNQRAAVFVDEIPIFMNDLSFLSIMDIAMIKIIKNPIVSGSRAPGGAVAIYTKHGEDEEEE